MLWAVHWRQWTWQQKMPQRMTLTWTLSVSKTKVSKGTNRSVRSYFMNQNCDGTHCMLNTFWLYGASLCSQVCRAVTRHPFQMPIYRATLGMRWEMSCCTHACRVMWCPVGTGPSACCVTAVGSGMDWWRYVSEVRSTLCQRAGQKWNKADRERDPPFAHRLQRLELWPRLRTSLRSTFLLLAPCCEITGARFLAFGKQSPSCASGWKWQRWYLSVTYHRVAQFLAKGEGAKVCGSRAPGLWLWLANIVIVLFVLLNWGLVRWFKTQQSLYAPDCINT